MRLSLIVLYAATAETMPMVARFYGAALGTEPVAERHGEGPQHFSVTDPAGNTVVLLGSSA
ncbi:MULTISPECIES: hypothetical protein [unclassified Mycolicibacterium]|uniref:hypothetical protein n=1 Tax=unclassified Mycolicibacterium TaxID=2636767 RepID=UPI0012DCE094|nr:MULTISPECIES: hypothetical protein [unclassified Mycolicibacterium]MUL84326.1 hypothetical protein [Mycolicibacterium sp. CBMA 329]MUL89608.1 hypothetical protein [Mycolicibacterium sp. CBMA 331]MUL99784.1 hypothetical protein [Mycolicibacterium sp. CBMA 334]MUM29577.1 hypothetical protein [Mycolicibacterium sp. CBMA 295]MUM39123.1 hypothetical protein [Mycolicibacterium sp. CBMA 247]